MRFGLCIHADGIARAKRVGADYCELSASDIYNMSDAEFESVKNELIKNDIEAYSCNGLVIPSVRLTGDDVDYDKVKAYAEKTFYRLSVLGIKMMVFGSGKAKHVPDGFPMEKAWEQLYDVGRIFSDCAKKYSQTVVVEALRYAEVNIVNTIEDAAKYVKNVDRDNFKIMVDFYHMCQNEESLDVITKYAKDILHVHMANPQRVMPVEADKQFVEDRMSKLKEAGFKGGISFECGMPDDEEAIKNMLNWFRTLA